MANCWIPNVDCHWWLRFRGELALKPPSTDYALMLSMSKEVPCYLDEVPRVATGFVLPVASEAFEESGRSLVHGTLDYLQGLKEKQEITIEKAMRNKRKCITTVKGLHLFVSGDPGFLFFGAFDCNLCLWSRPKIAMRSSKSRRKESTDSGSQLNSLQLNSEIVGTSRLIAT